MVASSSDNEEPIEERDASYNKSEEQPSLEVPAAPSITLPTLPGLPGLPSAPTLILPEQSASEATAEQKDAKVSFDPSQLLADAKKYAGKDKTVLALAKKVEAEIASAGATRGAVGGAKYGEGRVYGKDYTDYTAKFWANELAEVVVIGDGDNDLDLYIYDQNGNLIASDTDYTDQCVCRWVPSWTGAFTIRIVNRGAIYSNFAIQNS